MSSRHRPLRSEYPSAFSPLRPPLRAPRAPATSPCHRLSPRWGSGTSTRRNQHTTPRRARAPPVVSTPRPSLRNSFRDMSSMSRCRPSRPSPAPPVPAIASFATRVVSVAARVWPPRWRARPRTRAVRDVRSDAVVAEVVFSFAYLATQDRRRSEQPCRRPMRKDGTGLAARSEHLCVAVLKLAQPD